MSAHFDNNFRLIPGFRKARNTRMTLVSRILISSLFAISAILHSIESLCPYSSTVFRRPSTLANLAPSDRSWNVASRSQLVLRAADVSKVNEKQEESPKKSATPKVALSNNPVSKFRKLKDIMWIREAVEDLTATEFACSVEAGEKISNRKQKRAVDYEKLLSQLDQRVSDLTQQPFNDVILHENKLELDENVGMGRFVYTEEQRLGLLK
eukprot:scaffold1398_cov116-Cylindrotheca_fusiformis.AAC.6